MAHVPLSPGEFLNEPLLPVGPSALPGGSPLPRHWLVFLLFLFAAYAGLTWAVSGNSFFWDSILLSATYADWYYLHDFRHLFVPDDLAAGYPPLFGMYLAAGWKVFGRSLQASHWLMLPLLWGMVVQVFLLVRRLLPPKALVPGVLLLLLEPTLLAQSTQVAPDVALVFLYLLCLNAILSRNRLLLALGVVFLALVSLRGTVSVGAIVLTDVGLHLYGRRPQAWLRAVGPLVGAYLPAVCLTGLWLALYYRHYGWIGYNPDPDYPWAENSQILGLAGILRNVGIMGWRILDMGRFLIWVVGAVVVWRLYRSRRLAFSAATLRLLVLLGAPALVYALVMLPFSNTIGHRYLIVVYLLFALLVLHLLYQLRSARLRAVLYALMVAGCVGGHFIVYPDTVAKGWDASLAHLPYYSLRREMMQWMEQQRIPIKQTGSAFPNTTALRYTDLTEEERAFPEADFEEHRYIFHSNIFNTFSDAELVELRERWVLLKELRRGQVYIRLYQNPERR